VIPKWLSSVKIVRLALRAVLLRASGHCLV